MIEQILPPAVCIGEAFGDRPDVELYPQESAVIARAVESRRREFATVRGCARDALGALGVGPAPILPGPRGAPIWPPGVVGSMTHCVGYRGAVVARSTDLSSIGIDAEPNQPLPAGLIDRISVAEEREQLAEWDDHDVCIDRLLFCVKETVFKTWFPLTQRYLDFHEARATLRGDGSFSAVVSLDGPPATSSWPTGFTGRWLVTRGLVLSSSSIAGTAVNEGTTPVNASGHSRWRPARQRIR